jgi:hypothetical protein
MRERISRIALGLAALGVAAGMYCGKIDADELEMPVRWLHQHYGNGQPLDARRVTAAALGVSGTTLVALGVFKGGGKGWHLSKSGRDGMATVLLWWSQRDPFTVRDLLNGGVLIVGRSGSGKTSSSGKVLARGILKLPRSGGLILSATPSDREMWEQLFRECGREGDMRVFGPQESLRCNALDYIMRTGGSPRDITKFLTVIGETLKASDQKGGENAEFFEKQEGRQIYHSVVIVTLAEGQVSAAVLQKFIATAAQSPEQLKEEAWANGFHAQMLRKAHEAKKTKIEEQDYRQACEYFLGEWPALDNRTRSNIQTGVFGILHVLCTGIVNELLSTTTNASPDDLFCGRWILVDMSPNEWGEMGLCVAGAWKYLTQKAILKRRVDERSNVVMVFADEAHQFLTSFDSPFCAMVRARKGALIYLVQSVNAFYARLKGDAGKHEVNALLANWHHKIFHALGDTQTAELAVGLLGKQLTTFIGGSMAPQTSLQDELMGRCSYTGSFNEHYSEVLQSNVFINGLRTGGPENAYCCDAIVIRNGIPFADGNNFLFCTFSQK